MIKLKNIFTILIGGSVLSLAMFWVIATMVSGSNQLEKKDSVKRNFDFIMVKRDESENIRKREVPKKPKPPKQPKKPKLDLKQNVPQQNNVNLKVPDIDLKLSSVNTLGDAKVSGLGDIAISANLIPLVRIEPRYPRRAKMLKKQGQVTVEFTITERGFVEDPKVVKATPPKIFNQAALSAIKRWKFKPKVEDGKAVSQRAVLSFEFKLDK
ncbi:MAG: energy transducer TonB [Campylobacterales bacterium]|nr:energy transducer TonB [Campylobacterales bacterium]